MNIRSLDPITSPLYSIKKSIKWIIAAKWRFFSRTCRTQRRWRELENPVSNYVQVWSHSTHRCGNKNCIAGRFASIFPAKEVHNVSLFYTPISYMLSPSHVLILYLIRNSVRSIREQKNVHIFTYSIAMYTHKNLVFALYSHTVLTIVFGGVRRFDRETRSQAQRIT